MGSNPVVDDEEPHSEVIQRVYYLALTDLVDILVESVDSRPDRFNQVAAKVFEGIIYIEEQCP